MSSGPNHRRGHDRIQGNGPRWEGPNPEDGCNSTHVARARSTWKRIANRTERRTGAYDGIGPSGRRERPEAEEEAEMNRTTQDTHTALALGKLALAFGRVNRATYHEDGELPESDPTHVVMLSLIACELAPDDYDRGLIAQFVVVHDLVEAKVDDTNTFDITPEERVAKEKREQEAFLDLCEEFGSDSWMMRMLHTYEEQKVPEARYVRFLDKATPKITHALNGCAAIKKMGHSHDKLVENHNTQLEKLLLQYPEFADTRTAYLLGALMSLSEKAY